MIQSVSAGTPLYRRRRGISVTSSAAASGFSAAVLADSPSQYLRVGETSGTNAADASGNSRVGTYGTGVTLNQASLLTTDSNPSVSLDGTANAKINTTYNPFTGATTFEGLANHTNLSGNHSLFGGDGANQPQFVILTSGNFIWDPDRSGAGSTAQWVAPAGTGIGTTFLWALRIPSSTNAELFINGVSKGLITGLKAYGAAPGNIDWGALPAGEQFLGKIDEQLVFPSAVSDARLAAHAAAR